MADNEPDPAPGAEASKTASRSYVYPILAVVLTVVLLFQIYYLRNHSASKPPSTSTSASPRFNSGGGPSLSDADVPIVGPVLTTDPKTWVLLRMDYLCGAIIAIDSPKATSLTLAQWKSLFEQADEIHKLTEKMSGTARLDQAEKELKETAQKELQPPQIVAILQNWQTVARTPFSPDDVIAELRKIASSQGTSSPGPGTASVAPGANPTSQNIDAFWPGFILAGLNYLEKAPGVLRLTPAQAKNLLPKAEAYVEVMKLEADLIYSRVIKIFTDTQLNALVQALNQVHSGQAAPDTVKGSGQDFPQYGQDRIKQLESGQSGTSQGSAQK